MARHEPSGSKNGSRVWPYVVWGIVALVVGIGGMLGILTFAGISLLPSRLVLFQVPVLVNSAHGQVVAAAVSWFAGTVALFTYFLNRDQKEQHLRAQLNETRNLEAARIKQQDELEAARIKQQQEFEAARERRERDLAELQRLEAEFAALASDFAQPAGLARINAAIGLGEIALKPDPRRMTDTGELMEDPREPVSWTDEYGESQSITFRMEWRSLKTERNYPYFLRAAHRLAAALHQWEDVAPRAQAIRVLKELGDWAKDEGTDEPLLHALCNAVAEANRTVWKLLKNHVDWCSYLGLDTEVFLAPLFLNSKPASYNGDVHWESAQRAFAKDLFEYQGARLANGEFTAVDPASGTDESQLREPLREKFCSLVESLWATRDALASGLCKLSAPPDLPTLPSTPIKDQSETHEKNLERMLKGVRLIGDWEWENSIVVHRRALDLKEVRMFGARLSWSNLQGATCQYSHFEATSLLASDLSGANLYGAELVGASCDHASFRKAHLNGANLTDTFCEGTCFVEANISGALFEGAKFDEADFRDSLDFGP